MNTNLISTSKPAKVHLWSAGRYLTTVLIAVHTAEDAEVVWRHRHFRVTYQATDGGWVASEIL